MSQPRILEQFYSRLGPIYNFIFSKLFFNEGRKVAIDFLKIKKGHKILEVGVGTGLTLPMYPPDCSVEGVDLSESMLHEAEKLIKQYNLPSTVKIMDATRLEYPDNTFDGVLGNLFISATTFPVQALLEMKRVCKPGGTIVLMNHFQSEKKWLASFEKLVDPVTSKAFGFHSALKMEPLLKEVGLEVQQLRKVNVCNLWTAVSMVNKK